MKLRAKSICFLAASFGGLFLLVAAAALLVLLPAANQADEQSMQLRLERLQSRIDQQIEQVRVYAQEYGPWNETLEFVRGKNPAFLDDNFSYESLSSAGMAITAIWDAEGRMLGARSYDQATEQARDVPAPILRALETWPHLHQHMVGESSEGIMVSPAGLLLVSAQPVTSNERESFSSGTFLAAQILDAQMLSRLSVGETHSISLLDDQSLAASAPDDAPWDGFMREVLLLRDPSRQPVARLLITAPRLVNEIQVRGLWLVFGTLSAGGLFMGLFAWSLLSRRFIVRIEGLTADVARLESDATLRTRLTDTPGDDELSQLARDTGAMAGKLADARHSAESATRAKGAFLAAMSHEIRTPLNGVLGYLGLLRETALSPEQSEHVRIIEESGEGLLGVINEILDYSKLESGRVTFESLPTDARGIASEVLSLFSPRLKSKNVQSRLEIHKDVPARILADPLRLRQVLTNLLSNAEKFTLSGEISIRLDPLGNGVEGLRIAMRDTGIGMAPDQIARGFQPFSQADTSIARRFGGTGLGLAITERLVVAWGGTLSVASEVGRGSTFTFTLPAATATQAPATRDTTPVNVQPEHLPALKILIAEDNPVNARLLLAFLKKFGQEAEHVVNGRAALDAIKRSDFDLVLMDVQMPELDGLEATRQQRARERETNRPPQLIAALTANALAGAREECLAAGMDDYLAKPFQPTQLRLLLERASARRTQAMSARCAS